MNNKLIKNILFIILISFIVSCEGKNCIEADDFGEYDTDVVPVDSVSAGCKWNIVDDTGDDTVSNCLNSSSSLSDKTKIEVNDGYIIKKTDNADTNNICEAVRNCYNKVSDTCYDGENSYFSYHTTDNENNEAPNESMSPITGNPSMTQFHYNIQIHLPATNDISVYNAIFKSLKENLMM